MTTFQKIKKRDGKIVKFQIEKIANAIYKATEAVGDSNSDLAEKLAKKVLEKLGEKISANTIPKVEEVQDIVEQVLIEEGRAKVAKSYILYRRKRTEIRANKQKILDKDEIDEVDKKFDLNALRILRSRYLRKGPSGNVIESPKELFQRVAVHVSLASLLYDQKVFQRKGAPRHPTTDFRPEQWEGKIKIGDFVLNRFHLITLKRVYDRFNLRGQAKISWSEFFNLLKKGFFSNYQKEIQDYYDLMVRRVFLPNTPALVNFGNHLGMGSACFTLGIDDSIESIMSTLEKAAIIFKAGGGVGYNFSKLRPEGDFIKTTGGLSSGPLSFMSLFDKMTDVVKQGGIRRGASIGILDSDHPDIEKFILAKAGNKALRNFNLSVFIKENFWEYYKKKKPYPLINPRNGEVVKRIDPQALLDLIVYQAWESGEPGVIFDEQINKYNPFFKTLGPIKSTNPCGEVPLYANGSCNLGSINVWAFAHSEPTNGKQRSIKFDWEDFARTTRLATKFLDNVIEVNSYPLRVIEERALNFRKIGLGVMGLGDLLYSLEIPYNSQRGLDFMEKVVEFLNYHSKVTSIMLAKERGPFPSYKQSFYQEGKLPFRGFEDKSSWHFDWLEISKAVKKYGIRNAHTTVVAPTGSISMIAGASSGIEPVFSLIFEKKVTVGSFYYVDPVFEAVMKKEGLFDDDLIHDVAQARGSIKDLSYIAPRWKKVFVTAMDMKAKDHVKALATLQKWVDGSISKTINFPQEATVFQMKEAYLLAHQLGCKDITAFRDKSMKGVLDAGKRKEKKIDQKIKPKGTELVNLEDVKAKGPSIYHKAGVNEDEGFIGQDFKNNSAYKTSLESSQGGESQLEFCPECGTRLINIEGCKKCPSCGWSACTTS